MRFESAGERRELVHLPSRDVYLITEGCIHTAYCDAHTDESCECAEMTVRFIDAVLDLEASVEAKKAAGTLITPAAAPCRRRRAA